MKIYFHIRILLFPPVCISSLICSHVERKKIWKKLNEKLFHFNFYHFFPFLKNNKKIMSHELKFVCHLEIEEVIKI